MSSFYVYRCQPHAQIDDGSFQQGEWTTDRARAVDLARNASEPTNVLRGTVTDIVFYPVKQDGESS